MEGLQEGVTTKKDFGCRCMFLNSPMKWALVHWLTGQERREKVARMSVFRKMADFPLKIEDEKPD